jgi:nitrous oxidase accessory protein
VVGPAGLSTSLSDAPEGSVLCLLPGDYAPVTIDRRVTVWGPRDAVFRSAQGTTVTLTADGAALLGVTVDGSGGRFDTADAAVAVREAGGVRIEGVHVVHALFGIVVDQSRGAIVRRNRIDGDPGSPRGMRGDAIRLWETRDTLVEENEIEHGRDLVFWYSPDNRFVGNHVSGGRYGAHFMFSHDNVVERNVFRSNTVGVFVMYSRGIRLSDNDVLDASGAAGIGVGLKESGNVQITGNRFVHNAVGLFVDTSPFAMGDRDLIEDNRFELGGTAVVFHGRADGNELRHNVFRSNRRHVAVEGGGNALAATFEGNAYDDYAGYDLDGDGVGDVPHEVRSLSNELSDEHAALELFAGTPALAAVDALGRIVPLFTPRPLLVDRAPRMEVDRED